MQLDCSPVKLANLELKNWLKQGYLQLAFVLPGPAYVRLPN